MNDSLSHSLSVGDSDLVTMNIAKLWNWRYSYNSHPRQAPVIQSSFAKQRYKHLIFSSLTENMINNGI